jgi:glyoxylase-like metal-dependent hydrolase (beta-lactamase superfamily II)
MTKQYEVQAFFDEATFTVTYVVSDPETRDAVVIDPVLDYDNLSSQTSTKSIEKVLDYVREKDLSLRASLETHAHADHLTASPYLSDVLGIPVAIGDGISEVQKTFKAVFNLGPGAKTDGSQFDVLLSNNRPHAFGSIVVLPLATPGHTPACMSYLIGDAVFTGDALFMEDYGTGRTDFPRGSAEDLYHSVTDVLYELPEETRVFVGHDYLPAGREVRFESTISREKEGNIQLPAGKREDAFVRFRNERDAQLAAPRLLYQSVQVNVFGGRLPQPEPNGIRYLKIPLNLRAPTDDAGRIEQEAAE